MNTTAVSSSSSSSSTIAVATSTDASFNATVTTLSHVVTDHTHPTPAAWFHECRNHLPSGVLVTSSIAVSLVCLLMIFSTWIATFKLSHVSIKAHFFPMERKVVLLQYLLLVPCFELFVVWGPHNGILQDHSTSSSVITWLVINSIAAGCLIGAVCSAVRFRMLVHLAQCIRLPLGVMFFCDRLYNSTIGLEGAVIACMALCSFFEMMHVDEYFATSHDTILYEYKRDDLSCYGEVRDELGASGKMRQYFVDGVRRQFVGESTNVDAGFHNGAEMRSMEDSTESERGEAEEDEAASSMSLGGQFNERATDEVMLQMNKQQAALTQTKIIEDLRRVRLDIGAKEARAVLLRLRKRAQSSSLKRDTSVTEETNEASSSSIFTGTASRRRAADEEESF